MEELASEVSAAGVGERRSRGSDVELRAHFSTSWRQFCAQEVGGPSASDLITLHHDRTGDCRRRRAHGGAEPDLERIVGLHPLCRSGVLGDTLQKFTSDSLSVIGGSGPMLR